VNLGVKQRQRVQRLLIVRTQARIQRGELVGERVFEGLLGVGLLWNTVVARATFRMNTDMSP
jgi:hypothetical protein